MNRSRRHHRHCRRRGGATTVEFALVAPIIFTVFFGAIEIANLNYLRNLANDTAFQVARDVIVPGAQVDDIETAAKNFLAANGVAATVIDTNDIGDWIEVVVTIPIEQNSWGVAQFVFGGDIIQRCELSKQLE